MKELSLNLLDVTLNSVRAEAQNILVELEETGNFAEDVVKGEVSSNECIVMMRALLWHLAEKKFKGEEPLGEDTETGGKT